jgi:hypothetical protein
MWDSTALDRQLSILQQIRRSMIIYTLYSQRSRSVESHICRYAQRERAYLPLVSFHRKASSSA